MNLLYYLQMILKKLKINYIALKTEMFFLFFVCFCLFKAFFFQAELYANEIISRVVKMLHF